MRAPEYGLALTSELSPDLLCIAGFDRFYGDAPMRRT